MPPTASPSPLPHESANRDEGRLGVAGLSAYGESKVDYVTLARAIGAELRKTAGQRERNGESASAAVSLLRESGLVNLLIPKKFGGLGATFKEVAHVILEISKGDASIGALLAFHFDVSAIPRLSDFKGGAEVIERASAEGRWFWGNSLQGGFVKTFTATPLPGGRFRLNGRKEWSTGFPDANMAIVMAYRPDIDEVVFFRIPPDRKGLVFHDDWDHLGLRLSNIVTIDYIDVEVEADEVIVSTHGKRVVGFPPFYNSISSVFLNGATQLGAALGAVEQARAYTKTKTRPRGGLASATEDPYILAGYGEFWIKLRAALALLDKVAEEAQEAYERRLTSLTPREIGEIGISAAALRVFTAQVGLEVTSRVYDVTGAHATANSHGFDRYWRDIRILSARHPLSYATKSVGDYALNDVVNEGGAFI
jgi:alkylation response protein AidB-like acyl-CoA dehydrogenase